MAVKKKQLDEFDLGDDDADFLDQPNNEFDESFDDDNDLRSGNRFFDESFDDFDTGLRNQPDVYRIWLDTSPHIRDLYLSLTNQTIKKIKVMKGGRTFYKTKIVPISYVENGETKVLPPLANEKGVSQIMTNFKAFVSSPIVQGNLTQANYHRQLLWYSEKFTIILWTNRLNWGINLHDVTQINTMVVGSVELFLTRLIGNLERSREKANPNLAFNNDKEGLIDKMAFWRKQNDCDDKTTKKHKSWKPDK